VSDEFPKEEFELLRNILDDFIHDNCQSKEQIELFMMALVLTTLSSYSIDVESFLERTNSTHKNALTSIEDVRRVLSKFMKGEPK
jgi:hypothetical protein